MHCVLYCAILFYTPEQLATVTMYGDLSFDTLAVIQNHDFSVYLDLAILWDENDSQVWGSKYIMYAYIFMHVCNSTWGR